MEFKDYYKIIEVARDGAALALELLDEIASLKTRLRAMGGE